MVILTPKFVKLENGISSRQKPLFMFVLHDSFGYSSSRVFASKGAFFRIYSSLFLISSPFGSIT